MSQPRCDAEGSAAALLKARPLLLEEILCDGIELEVLLVDFVESLERGRRE
jgi:hypothetical protein